MLNFKNRLLLITLLLLGSTTIVYSANATAINPIVFAGRTWDIRSGVGGPGALNVGNNWSTSTRDVFVDGTDLHLNVSQHDGQWYSSEVSLLDSLGYGKYTFDIDPKLNSLDKNLVAAPFLYQDDDHEIDIEHSYWANTSTDTNLYYTVQPYDKPGNQQTQSLAWPNTTFQDIIYWEPNKITLSTEQGGNQLSSWVYTSSTDATSNNFTPGKERVHINFWQYQSLVPLDVSSTHEFIINNFTFEPLVISSVLDDNTTSTLASGGGSSGGFGPSAPSTIPVTTSTANTSSTLAINLNIRYNNTLIFSGSVNLATSTTITDDQRNSTTTTSTTALTALINSENQTGTFSIYELQHSNYGYYVKCLYLSISSTSTCDNWNYVVDNKYPSVGMDSYPLKGGENIYIYFGDSWKITAASDAFYTNTSTPFYTWKYDYSDINHDWIMDPSDLVAITAPNPTPTDWWDTDITVSTTMSNDQGVAYYNFTSIGTYSAKITATDFSKWSNPITFTVTNTPAIQNTTTTTSTSTNNSGNSGGSSNTPTNQLISTEKINDAVTKIINFLKSKQDVDGMISDANTSDWTAMALGSKKIYASDVKNGGKSLYDFIYNTKIADIEQESNKCAGYSRHIMALLSSGVSKTDPKIMELKNKLNTTCVQNNIFGLSGINDDVFGLIAALALDEEQTSVVVTTTLASIKADQQIDGSFTWDGWAGADMTGAAINALKYAQNNGITIEPDIFTKAKQYLKSKQHDDGGWGCYDYNNGCLESDALTTGWVVMGINSLTETQNNWSNSAGKNPWYILTTLDNDHFTQSWDGGVDWFGTKHAVPALLGLSWPITLDPKPTTIAPTPGGSSAVTVNTTTTIATSTIATTSTTPIIATTTIATPTSTALVTPKILTANTVVLKNPSTQNKPENKVAKTILKDTKKEIVIKPQQELTAGQPQAKENKTLDNLPLDTPTKRNAKKLLEISGGSALIVGAYLGFRLLRNMI